MIGALQEINIVAGVTKYLLVNIGHLHITQHHRQYI